MIDLNNIFNIDSEATSKHFKKGKILQREGDTSSRAFFVKSGLLRSYTIDDKGKEHIFMFAPEGWINADIESQEFNHPTELFIDCLEDSEVVIIDRHNLNLPNLSKDQLLENVKLLSRRIGVLQNRVIRLMSASASQRYKFFLDTYPELPHRVPQRMIASFLGITPEALSKIRGEIARSK